MMLKIESFPPEIKARNFIWCYYKLHFDKKPFIKDMQKLILSKQSLFLTFITAFYKRQKQSGVFVLQGKQLLESIIDYVFESTLLNQRLGKRQDQLEREYILKTIDVINANIQSKLIKFSDIVAKYVSQIQQIRNISDKVNDLLQSINDPTKLLKQQTSCSKLTYIEALFQLLTLIKEYCQNYDDYIKRIMKIQNVFQQISVNQIIPQQNTLKYYLFIWIHEPLLKDVSSFSQKYANLQKLKMAIR